jgi:hypothetical protein
MTPTTYRPVESPATSPPVQTLAAGAVLPLLAILPIIAGCAPNAAPTATEAIDRMLAAIGSQRDRDNVRSLRTVAECSGPDGLFVTSVTSIRPDTVYFHQQSGLGATEIWSTPQRTWGGSNQEAYAELAPAVRDFVRGHEFHLMLLDLPMRFTAFSVQGEDRVDESACLRITMTDESGADASICLGERDWLPLELQLAPAGAEGPIRVRYGEWRAVDGLNWFHAFRLTEGSEEYSYEFVEISASSFGQELDIQPPGVPPHETSET